MDRSFGQVPATERLAAGSSLSANSSPFPLGNLSGTRQLSNVPDDVGYQLYESDDQTDATLPLGPLEPLHRLWDRTNGHLRRSISLDLGLNYTAAYQRADSAIQGPKDASDGDLDFFGRWHLTGYEDEWPGSLVFSAENRHRLSKIPPADLNTGAVGGIIVGFGVQDFSLVQCYWEQGSFEDRLILRVGRMDPALIYDGGRYVSSNYAFFSPAFSDTLPMAVPDAGLGIAAGLYPTESSYIAGGFHDANGRRTTAGWNTFFEEAEFYSAIELGWFPNEGQPNEASYHFTLWHIDARRDAKRPSDHGLALTLEQETGCRGRYVPFVRYAYAKRGLNDVRQNLSIGIGIEEVFDKNFDLIGTAFSWQDPSTAGLGDQYVFETFYRFVVTPHTHVTPDLQVIVDPAREPSRNAVTVFGLRVRTLY